LNAKTSILNKDDKSYSYFFKKIKKEKLNYSSKDKLDLNRLMGESREKVGEYNLQNARAAATVAKKLGISREVVDAALSNMSPPKGRLEKVKNNKDIDLYIDFAHTPNALKEVLTLLKDIKKGRLIAVFGCAGERDIKKRRMMAKISTELADVSVFTAEDPRSEDVNDILKEMERGVVKKAEYYKIPERGEAIGFAVNKIARERDMVVICGKAHEKSMAYNGIEYPWSDFKAVEYALKGKTLEIMR
jgi:UDP-N-acetylmuramoyl-L-alanyl-D-glutamate--2,6-diaminopimelate ligase